VTGCQGKSRYRKKKRLEQQKTGGGQAGAGQKVNGVPPRQKKKTKWGQRVGGEGTGDYRVPRVLWFNATLRSVQAVGNWERKKKTLTAPARRKGGGNATLAPERQNTTSISAKQLWGWESGEKRGGRQGKSKKGPVTKFTLQNRNGVRRLSILGKPPDAEVLESGGRYRGC